MAEVTVLLESDYDFKKCKRHLNRNSLLFLRHYISDKGQHNHNRRNTTVCDTNCMGVENEVDKLYK